MSRYKIEFDLLKHRRNEKGGYDPEVCGKVNIVKRRGRNKELPPIVIIRSPFGINDLYIDSKDLKKFAENILRTLEE